MSPESLIPEQREGIAKKVHHQTEAGSEAEAACIFEQAEQRLRQPSCWAATAEGMSASFLLYDAGGKTVLDRPAETGDLVRIDLPAPHRSSASGYDWVRLDPVQKGSDEHGPWIILTTRPAPDPTVPENDTAHFFAPDSSGTFLIRRRGRVVEGTHYGRNELPNTGEGNLADKARAVAVTLGAFLGLSNVQWSNLIKGLISSVK